VREGIMDGILKGLKEEAYRVDSTHNIIPPMNMNKCSVGTVRIGLSNVQQ